MIFPLTIPSKLSIAEAERILRIELHDSWAKPGKRNRPGGNHAKTSVTIHNTGNPSRGADALAHARYMGGADAWKRRVSWHYTVDDKRVVKHMEATERAWHTSSAEANRHSVAIEICENADCDLLLAVDRAALLTALLMKVLQIDVIKTHQDWTGKACPSRILAMHNGEDEFEARARKWLASLDW